MIPTLILARAALALGSPAELPALDPPFVVEAGGEPIVAEVGHAAPLLVDFDGDGKRDLLVGEFGGGRLRIYKNVGEDAAPRFDDYEYFKVGGEDATVPSS